MIDDHDNDECSLVNYDLEIENNSGDQHFEITSEQILANARKSKRIDLDPKVNAADSIEQFNPMDSLDIKILNDDDA